MRLAALCLVLAAGSCALGWLSFDSAGPTSTEAVRPVHAARSARVAGAEPRPAGAPGAPPFASPAPRVATPVPPPADEPSDDEVLLEMLAAHRDAMLMLREALYYDVVDRVDSCGDHVTARVSCWLHFRIELGTPSYQMMQAQLSHVTCGDPADRRLPACLRERLAGPRDPIGAPREAADELGSYSGPLYLALAWYP